MTDMIFAAAQKMGVDLTQPAAKPGPKTATVAEPAEAREAGYATVSNRATHRRTSQVVLDEGVTVIERTPAKITIGKNGGTSDRVHEVLLSTGKVVYGCGESGCEEFLYETVHGVYQHRRFQHPELANESNMRRTKRPDGALVNGRKALAALDSAREALIDALRAAASENASEAAAKMREVKARESQEYKAKYEKAVADLTTAEKTIADLERRLAEVEPIIAAFKAVNRMVGN